MKVAIFISDIATKIGSNGSVLIIYSRNLSGNWIPFHLLWPLPYALSASSCSFLFPCHLICCYHFWVSQKHTLHTRQDNIFQNYSLTAVFVWLNPVWLKSEQNICIGSHHPPILGLARHVRKESHPITFLVSQLCAAWIFPLHILSYFSIFNILLLVPHMFTNRNMTNSIDETQFSETWVAKEKCGISPQMWHTCACASMCQDWHRREVKEDRHDWRKGLSKEGALSNKSQQQVAQYFNLLSSLENGVVLYKWKKMHT